MTTTVSRALLRLSLAACALLVCLAAAADVAVPPLRARVTDLTSTLTPQAQAALEQKLAAFEARKGSQLAVLIVPTTQPETIEQYSIRVVDQWKLGRKGIADGVLLLIAKDDRTLRIEVGRGLEGALPDITAKRIEAEYIVPRFRAGDYAGGIDAGVDRILAVIDGEPLPAPKAGRGAAPNIDLNTLLFVGFILVFVVGGVLRAMFGRLAGAGIVAAIAGALAWLLGGALLIGIGVGIMAFVFSLFGGTRGPWGGTPGGWGGGLGGGGGFGGGFGGGGGDFGGGGASSRW